MLFPCVHHSQWAISCPGWILERQERAHETNNTSNRPLISSWKRTTKRVFLVSPLLLLAAPSWNQLNKQKKVNRSHFALATPHWRPYKNLSTARVRNVLPIPSLNTHHRTHHFSTNISLALTLLISPLNPQYKQQSGFRYFYLDDLNRSNFKLLFRLVPHFSDGCSTE